MARPEAAAMSAFRAVFGVGLVAAIGVTTPACFFPEFTFGEGSGGEGGTTTTSTTDGSGGTTTTPSTTDGGGGTMTTSTTHGGGGTTTTSTEGGGGIGGMMTGGGGIGGMMTGGGGTTTTSTTTTTTTTPPPVEDCTNGVDDDLDGLADCKDLDDCADYTCVGSVPQGWTGYFFVYDGMLMGDPGCVDQAPTPMYVGANSLNAPPAECAACSCGAPQGEACTPTQMFTVADAPCGQQPTYTGPTNMPGGWTGSCAHHLNPMGQPTVWGSDFECGPDNLQQCNVSISGAAPTVQGGFCASSGGQATIVPAEWQGFGRACGDVPTTGKGCNLTQTCVPKPPAPYVGGICIKKNANNGATTCPSGVSLFKNQHTFFESFTDSRMCTGCSCGPDLGATCAGTYSVHSDLQINTCNQFVTSWTAGTCVNLPGNPIVGPFLFNITTPPTGGSCQPQGGMAVGQATPTFPTMYCCTD